MGLHQPELHLGLVPVIDDDPAYNDGQVCCPDVRRPARKAGAREKTREIVVLLDGAEADRIPIAEGTSIIVGRGRRRDRYDVRPTPRRRALPPREP